MDYPYEVSSHLTKNKTFCVEAQFSAQEDRSPLRVFDRKFSRFVITVIENGKALSANVPVGMMESIDQATRFAFGEHLRKASEPPAAPAAQARGQGPAFTVRIRAGQLKGLTPAEALAQKGGAAKGLLNSHYSWLKENLAKFPANREVMDAIADSARLDPSALAAAAPAPQAARPVTLLEIGCRPLIRKKREDGMAPCYECRAEWDSSRNYPVTVTVTSYYAPVAKREDGTLNVMLSQKDRDSEKRASFSMSATDWLSTVDAMRSAKQGFYMSRIARAFSLADRGDRANRDARAKQKGQDSVH